MKLISCSSCAVILDSDKILWPDIYLDDGCINEQNAVYYLDEYRPFVFCPVCNKKLISEEDV